jgi:hypothetical protein
MKVNGLNFTFGLLLLLLGLSWSRRHSEPQPFHQPIKPPVPAQQLQPNRQEYPQREFAQQLEHHGGRQFQGL